MQRSQRFLILSAQVLGIILLLLISGVLIQEGIPNPEMLNTQQLLVLLSFLLMAMGTITGLFKAAIAAALLILGSSMAILLESQLTPLVVLFLIDGVLYLAASCCPVRAVESPKN